MCRCSKGRLDPIVVLGRISPAASDRFLPPREERMPIQ
jgi:hypothetical protein